MKASEIWAVLQASDLSAAESPTSTKAALRRLVERGALRANSVHGAKFYYPTPTAKAALIQSRKVRARVRGEARRLRRLMEGENDHNQAS
jgi:hypothetical protein